MCECVHTQDYKGERKIQTFEKKRKICFSICLLSKFDVKITRSDRYYGTNDPARIYKDIFKIFILIFNII